ncbi:DUF2341 domain-containing protein [Paraliomyxa miuraensis]|uniref:DUF2341 domain-containing protein n=1 Tax=Paraliomyxa miuraensis TaxID=376150 RepID=UPI0022534F8C|nr:DUF2341 domain-containing protein [Paraliomyxa miuraensis]MCX4247178.1 hypothetical protein [Paraliomyxa miuraensis]
MASRGLRIVGLCGPFALGCSPYGGGVSMSSGVLGNSTGDTDGTTSPTGDPELTSADAADTTAGPSTATITTSASASASDTADTADTGMLEPFYRREIVIAAAEVPGTQPLLDFTALIAFAGDEGLRDVASGGHVLEPDGADLVFRDANLQPLARELVSYAAGSGRFVIWVRIPEIAADVDTTIYLDYGAPSLVDLSPTNAWNDAYRAVWHFEEPVVEGGQIRDSSDHGNHGTATNMDASNGGMGGRVGRAVSFSQPNATIVIGNGGLDLPGPVTFEGWGRMDASYAGWQRLFHKGTELDFPLSMGVGDSATGQLGTAYLAVNYLSIPSVDLEYPIPGFAYGQWYHYAGVVGGPGNDVALFVNGVRVLSTTFTNPIETGHALLHLGNMSATGSSRLWSGMIDELRFSNVARSDAWIEAGFRNTSTPTSFAKVGTEQPMP